MLDCPLDALVPFTLRLGARLALLALVVQLVVSFAHVHPEDIAPGAAAATLTASAGAGVPSFGGTSPPHQSDPDAVCAICALIQLVQASVPAAAPALRVPTALAWIRPKLSIEAAAPVSLHALFQARAPPSA